MTQITRPRRFGKTLNMSMVEQFFSVNDADRGDLFEGLSIFTFTRNPKDPDSYFAPDGKTTNGYNQVHVIALFDLLSKRYCDSIVQPIRKKNEFPAEEIKEHCGLRWNLETSFRELKHTIGATNFHSKKREYIEMEVWARLILYNFCSIITRHVVIDQKHRKHIYQVNYTVAYNACHYLLRLHNGEEPPNIEGLIVQNILPIRPDRKECKSTNRR